MKYFVKARLDGVSVYVQLTDDNIYTKCAMCGKHIKTDLVEDIRDLGFDLYNNLKVCSDECAENVIKTLSKS